MTVERIEPYAISMTDDFRVRIAFCDAKGLPCFEITLDTFAARRFCREVEEWATVALNNTSATRTGSARPRPEGSE